MNDTPRRSNPLTQKQGDCFALRARNDEKRAIQTIDRALKDLYHLDSQPNAIDFILEHPIVSASDKVDAATLQGALYVEQSPEDDEQLSLGIYLDPELRNQLHDFESWTSPWTRQQLNAFSVVAEEISHFHYLIFQASRGRGVSQFELELQGEIDKFVLSYFTLRESGTFQALFESLFFRFHLCEQLTKEQRERYLDANRFARRFILKCRRYFSEANDRDTVLRVLRHFYRLGSAEKISYIHEG